MEAKYSILEWRNGLSQSGISDAGCPRMEEVLRAPAAHGVSSYVIGLCDWGAWSGLIRASETACITDTGHARCVRGTGQ